MYCRGIGVVGRLRTVHVVVGRTVFIFAVFVTHDFEGAVSYHLVGVHVGGGSGASLNHINRELIVIFAIDDFLTCLFDGLGLLFCQKSETVVGACGTHLGYGKAFNELWILVEMQMADLEIFDSAQSLHSVEQIVGNLTRADKVGLNAESGFTVCFH